MKIGIVGGGSVGQMLAGALIGKGHDVRLGIRNPSPAELDKPRTYARTLTEWSGDTGGQVVSFADAAAHGELVINATGGEVSIAALTQAGAERLAGKVLVDLANPLDFSQGFPPSLLTAYSQGTSLGEQIQKAFPEARVVKAFNTISASVIVDAGKIPGDHDLFIAGNDADAKATVSQIARDAFGWKSIVDLGDITGARATEHLLPFWLRLWQTTGTLGVNIKVVRD